MELNLSYITPKSVCYKECPATCFRYCFLVNEKGTPWSITSSFSTKPCFDAETQFQFRFTLLHEDHSHGCNTEMSPQVYCKESMSSISGSNAGVYIPIHSHTCRGVCHRTTLPSRFVKSNVVFKEHCVKSEYIRKGLGSCLCMGKIYMYTYT